MKQAGNESGNKFKQRGLLHGSIRRGIRCAFIRCVVLGQHCSAAVYILQGGIAEEYLALNINAVIQQGELTLQLIRAIPDIARLRFRRTVSADADVQGNVAGGYHLLPPIYQHLKIGDFIADRPIKLRTDVIHCSLFDPFDRIAVDLPIGGAAVGFAALGIVGFVIPNTGGADAER